ncbi:MarR family transcriptional regulator for hemolysin [Azoarcus indigens]|uniref:MarR family transcriptional regulator for hemolysin n=2 Tax=Azoarcus indigens TaxID=29545 RepID=A0A4V6PQM6_9RHOO|nr:MarR family transcriptional regulator for hemolysin [Azoarcus indigens]
MLMKNLTKDQHAVATLLHRAAALWRVKLDERLRPWGMTQATWRVLWALHTAGERYNQSSLATRLGIETPTLVRLLDRMEKLGLVGRSPDAQDRRQKYLEIKPDGLALVARIEGEVIGMREEMLAGLGQAELQACLKVLERVVANGGGKPAGDAAG